MPKAGLGPDVAIWVTENGYATRGGTGEERQAGDLTATLDALARYSGTLGITDYRYFNLRDNRSTGPDLFDAVGLLFDDYREKPAFAAFRGAVLAHGAPPPASWASPAGTAPARALRVTVRPRTVVRGRRTLLRVRVRSGGRDVYGALVRVGGRRARTGRSGRARLRYRFVGRPGRRLVRVTSNGRRATARIRVRRAAARSAHRAINPPLDDAMHRPNPLPQCRRCGPLAAAALAAPAQASSIAGCPLLPRTFPTNQRVDRLPVAPGLGRDRRLDRPGRPACTPTSAPAATRAGRSGSRTTWSPAHAAHDACASATRTSPTASATRSRAAVHIEGGRDADGDRHALLRRPQRLPALRAVRPPGPPGRVERRLGRDVEPALDAGPPGRLDLRRRGRPADPAAARPPRRGQARADRPRAARDGRRRRGAPSSTRRGTSRPTSPTRRCRGWASGCG